MRMQWRIHDLTFGGVYFFKGEGWGVGNPPLTVEVYVNFWPVLTVFLLKYCFKIYRNQRSERKKNEGI